MGLLFYPNKRFKPCWEAVDVLRKEILTVREVADYLRVSRVTVWRWCQEGTLPASRIGRNWRIRRDDLFQVLEERQPSRLGPDPV